MTLTSFSILVVTLGAPAVDHVVVYADRAQVTRTTTVTCTAAPVVFGELPPSLDRVVHRCLEKTPDDRYQAARDLHSDLEDLIISMGFITAEIWMQ